MDNLTLQVMILGMCAVVAVLIYSLIKSKRNGSDRTELQEPPDRERHIEADADFEYPADELANQPDSDLRSSSHYSRYRNLFDFISSNSSYPQYKIDWLLESLDMGHELEDNGFYVMDSIRNNLPYFCETESEFDLFFDSRAPVLKGSLEYIRELRSEQRSYHVILITLLLIAFLFLLNGCSPSAKRENEIIKDLQASNSFISPNIEIDSYEIIKRQTSKEDKKDIVYLTVHSTDAMISCDLSYIMEYILYNDSWVLESVERYADGEWNIKGISEEMLIKETVAYDRYCNSPNLSLEVTDYEIQNEGYEYSDGNYEKWFEVDVTASSWSVIYHASLYTVYQITEDGWNHEYAYIESSRYAPRYSPSVAVSNEIMDSYILVDIADPIYFDSYEYLTTEEDWENCSETRFYEATKEWYFGTETYLISIPMSFSLSEVDDEPTWTYSSDAIDMYPKSIVNWSIVGQWVNRSKPYLGNGYSNVYLDIDYIMPTNDSEVYSVSLRCNASSTEYDYYCDTYTNGIADVTLYRMKRSRPGVYYIFVDNLGDENYFWRGTFKLQGYSAGAVDQGFFWVYNSGPIGGECPLVQNMS